MRAVTVSPPFTLQSWGRERRVMFMVEEVDRRDEMRQRAQAR